MFPKSLIAVILSLFLFTCVEKPPDAPAAQRIEHVVLCWLKEHGNKAQRRQVIAESQALADIPGVLEIRVGEVLPSDRAIVDDSFDVGVIISFGSVEDMNRYITNKTHERIVKEKLMPLLAKIVVYDFSEKPLGEK